MWNEHKGQGKNVVSLWKIQGKSQRNYFCILPGMFSFTETNSCTHEQNHKLTVTIFYSNISQCDKVQPSHLFQQQILQVAPIHAWELALYTTVIARNPSSGPSELEDGAALLWRDNQPMNQCQESSSTAASCETGMVKPTCTRDWGLTLNPSVQMGRGSSNPTKKWLNF